jgi:hypothetical protein
MWTAELCDVLNGGVLPAGFFALIEQKAIGVEPDMLTLRASPEVLPDAEGGLAVATSPPKVRHHSIVVVPRRAFCHLGRVRL